MATPSPIADDRYHQREAFPKTVPPSFSPAATSPAVVAAFASVTDAFHSLAEH
jgi:hypothetical protein